MEEARAVITRLDRIEALARAREPAALVLSELELLVPEVICWLEREGPAAAAARVALERCLLVLAARAHFSCAAATREEHSLVCPCLE
ncbi:MAG TPA: hypothetical protein VII83_03955 [Gaiellaceae bacterium]